MSRAGQRAMREKLIRKGAQAHKGQDHRHNHHRRGRRDPEPDCTQGEQKGCAVETKEGSFLSLLIDYVERVKEGNNPRVGAPERDCETDQKGRAQRRCALTRDARHLLREQVQNPARQDTCEQGQMSAHGAHVCEQAIERHHGRESWKDGQQSKERHASGCGEHSILRDRPDHAPEDVRPTAARNVLRALGFAAAARLGGPLVG